MSRLAAIAPPALLAACVAAPTAEVEPPVPDPLPPAVARNLPAGVPASAVGLQDGCFLYDAPDGAVVLIRDDANRPICLEG